MGLFSFSNKQVLIHDEFFGELRLINFKDPSKNYFEGKGIFIPTNSETEFLIQADAEGPTGAQREFYNELQGNFERYVLKIKPLIENEFRNWQKDFEIREFNKEFYLVGITIPRVDSKPMIWDMSFTTVHDLNHQVTIDFVDTEPNGILIDG